MHYPNRIHELRRLKDVTLDQIAERAGTTNQMISKLEKGQSRLTDEWMRKIAPALGVRPWQLLREWRDEAAPAQEKRRGLVISTPLAPLSQVKGGRVRQQAEAATMAEASALEVSAPGVYAVASQEFTAIGRYDITFSAGPGSLLEAHPEPLGYHLMETQWLRALTRAAAEHLAITKVGGDSMIPTLWPDDWVLIDLTQKRLGREGIYSLRVGDDGWIKRLTLNLSKKLVQIISDNPVYPMQELPEGEINLIGRVLGIVARRLP